MVAHNRRAHLRLGCGTDTGYGKTDVDGGTDTTEEQLSLQEDLAVSDRNDLDEMLLARRGS